MLYFKDHAVEDLQQAIASIIKEHRMIHDREANYIVMTVSLYANLYVMFLHLLNLFHALTGDS